MTAHFDYFNHHNYLDNFNIKNINNYSNIKLSYNKKKALAKKNSLLSITQQQDYNACARIENLSNIIEKINEELNKRINKNIENIKFLKHENIELQELLESQYDDERKLEYAKEKACAAILNREILKKEKFADIVKSNPIIHKCYQIFIHNKKLIEKSDFSDFLIFCVENLLTINKSISESVYEMTKKYYMNIPKIPEGGDSPAASEHSVITADNLEKNYTVVKTLGLGDTKDVPLFNKSGERVSVKIRSRSRNE